MGFEMRQNLSHCALPPWALMSLARHGRFFVRRTTQLRGATYGTGLLCISRWRTPSQSCSHWTHTPQGSRSTANRLGPPFPQIRNKLGRFPLVQAHFRKIRQGRFKCISSKKRGQDPEYRSPLQIQGPPTCDLLQQNCERVKTQEY